MAYERHFFDDPGLFAKWSVEKITLRTSHKGLARHGKAGRMVKQRKTSEDRGNKDEIQ